MSSSLTVTQLIARVKQNVGARHTGQIGASSFDEAVLAKLNNVIMALGREFYYLPELQKKATINVSTSDFSYALPTTDTDSSTIRIRQITKATNVKSGEVVGFTLERISEQQKARLFPVTSSSLQTGRPRWYSVFANRVELHPYPDSTYTVTLYVSVWPSYLTAGSTLPYADEWNDVVEAGTTAEIFSALMLPDDAQIWMNHYGARLRSVRQSHLQKPDWSPGFYISDGHVSRDPVNDPFVKSFNSYGG